MIHRTPKNKGNPYLKVDKGFVNDDNLSMKAKGLMIYLLSLPDDWRVYEVELTGHFTDGKDAIHSAIMELIEHGYIERHRQRSENGRYSGYEYNIHEKPIDHCGKSATTDYKYTYKKKVELMIVGKEYKVVI